METSELENPETSLDRMRRLQSPHRASVSQMVAQLHSAYVGTGRDLLIEKRVEELIDHCIRVQDARAEGTAVGRLAEGRPLLVLGESGSGKTRSLLRIFKKRADFEGYGDRNSDCPLVSIDVPSPCSMRMLGVMLARALGYVSNRNHKETEIWDIVRTLLQRRGVYFVHFDEVGHVLQCNNPVEIQKVRNTFKALMQNKDWPVWLILSGTPQVSELTYDPEDEQVWRRALPLYIEDIAFPQDAVCIHHALAWLCRDKARLDISSIANDPFVARLMHAGINRLGIVIELTQDAAEVAIEAEARSLEIEHFAQAYTRRTGCTPDTNVFHVDNWEMIDPRLALRRRDGRLYIEPSEVAEPRNRRRK